MCHSTYTCTGSQRQISWCAHTARLEMRPSIIICSSAQSGDMSSHCWVRSFEGPPSHQLVYWGLQVGSQESVETHGENRKVQGLELVALLVWVVTLGMPHRQTRAMQP